MHAVHEGLYRNKVAPIAKNNLLDLQGSFDFTDTLLHFFSTTDSPSVPSEELLDSFLNEEGDETSNCERYTNTEEESMKWRNLDGSYIPSLCYNTMDDPGYRYLNGSTFSLEFLDEVELDEEIHSIQEEIARIEEQKYSLKHSKESLYVSISDSEAKANTDRPTLSINLLRDILSGVGQQLSFEESDGSTGGNSPVGSSIEDEDKEIVVQVEDSKQSTSSVALFTCKDTSTKKSKVRKNYPTKGGSESISKIMKRRKMNDGCVDPKLTAPLINIKLELELLDLDSNSYSSSNIASVGSSTPNYSTKILHSTNSECSYTPKKRRTKLMSPQNQRLRVDDVFKEEKILKINKATGPQDEDVDIGNLSDCTNY